MGTHGTNHSRVEFDRKESWGAPPASPFTYPPTIPGSSSSFGGHTEGANSGGSSGYDPSGEDYGAGHKRQRRDSEVMFGLAEEVGENRWVRMSWVGCVGGS